LTEFGDELLTKIYAMNLLQSACILCFSTASKSDVCLEWMSLRFKFVRESSIDKFEIKNLRIQQWNFIENLRYLYA